MPRTNLCEDRTKKRFDYVAAMLSGGFRLKNLSTRDVSQKSGIPERTVQARIQHPEEIRLKDLYTLADMAGVRITFEFKEIPD